MEYADVLASLGANVKGAAGRVKQLHPWQTRIRSAASTFAAAHWALNLLPG